MSQLLAVQQGHVYEGGNQSGWRRKRNLKSLSLSLSLSLSFFLSLVVSLHPAQSTRITPYVNTYTLRDAWCKRARAYASSTFPHTRYVRKIFYLFKSPVQSRKTIRRIPARFSTLIPREESISRSMGEERAPPPRKKPRFRRRVCFSLKKERVAGSCVITSQLRRQEKRRTDFQPGEHRLSPRPAGRWAIAPPPIARCRTTTGRRSPYSPFSFPSLHLPSAAPSTSLLLRPLSLASLLSPHVRTFPSE